MPPFQFDRTLRLRFLDIPAVGNPLELMQKTDRYSRFVSIVAYPPLGEETMRQDRERIDDERRAHRESGQIAFNRQIDQQSIPITLDTYVHPLLGQDQRWIAADERWEWQMGGADLADSGVSGSPAELQFVNRRNGPLREVCWERNVLRLPRFATAYGKGRPRARYQR
jgi:hypothetical protein